MPHTVCQVFIIVAICYRYYILSITMLSVSCCPFQSQPSKDGARRSLASMLRFRRETSDFSLVYNNRVFGLEGYVPGKIGTFTFFKVHRLL